MKQALRFSAIANLRVIAITAIMLNHAQIGIESDTRYSLSYLVYSQFFKFGSLLFMLISGFLFQKSVLKYELLELIKRKGLTILVPSLLFMLPWAILNIFILPSIGENKHAVDSQFAFNELYNLFFRSIYWFPINLFLILCLNNFIRDIRTIKFLIIPAALITLFYSANIYLHWVPRKHNSAILAYFTFFFTGRLIYAYFPVIKAYLVSIQNSIKIKAVTLILLLILFSLSVYESYYIQESNLNTDPGNILRISNILYTFMLLAFVFNYRDRIKTGNYFKEKSVFLIYLIHPYLLYIGKFLASSFNLNSKLHSATIIPLEVIYAFLILFISLIIARVLQSNETFNTLLGGKLKFGIRFRKTSTSQL